MTDKAVIESLKKGEQGGLKFVYSAHRLDFINFAKKYPIVEEDIIDVYQDAIIALRDSAIKGHVDTIKSELKTYLFSIGKYIIYAKLKQQRKVHLVEDHFDFNKNESIEMIDFFNQELTKEQEQLHAAFQTLGQKCKDVLTLFYYRGFNLEDIMNELNYNSKDVVKSQKSRCLKSLKALIFKM
ncbi:sigma-70 family RNA polymerase sigma factor [uncultured Psychroserpens sp.]|uniref:RNA polymerase sigma factor n=1 Tax=uncultured Psychroserpens sp. TaxID=255436 RepID=UPI0026053E89|nr:sigma-70 family RNA polymerase sigma factor [uncultured Psychroserpens sp.]